MSCDDESPKLKVVPLFESDYRDPVEGLRSVANDIEQGDIGEVRTIVLVSHSNLDDKSHVEIWALGREATDEKCLAVLQTGLKEMISMVMLRPPKK